MEPASLPRRLALLGDAARWRIVHLLAARPRPVGVVAQHADLRQPQATKHLQALERAGLVTARRSAQRRYYVLEPQPLRELAAAITELAETVEANRAEFDTLDDYVLAVDAERLAADRDGWADDRVFEFHRRIAAPREAVWRHLTAPDLLADWWTPRDLQMSRIELHARPGGRIVQEYVHAGDAQGSAGVVGYAEGAVTKVEAPGRLEFRLSPLMPDGSLAFTGHYIITLHDQAGETAVDVRLRITDSAIDSADFIAGIRIGWSQALDNLVAATTATATPQAAHIEEHS